jgi:POT family proton-dependent oligopeptide transporter
MNDTPRAEKKTLNQATKDAFKELADTFVAFFKAPRALWGINIPYILEGLVYFGILTILGKFGSENVGLTDPQAGWVYGGVTGGITFAMLLLGGVSDKIGVRRSLALALFTMMVGRAIVAFSGSIDLGQGITSPMFFTMSAGLILMVAAYGLYQPAAYAGVKRYTNPKTAAIGYAVIYGLMNLGAFFSGFISSNTRHIFESSFPPNGLTAVFWIYVALTGVAFLCTLILLTKKTDQKAVERISRETFDMNGSKKEDENGEKTQKEKINNSFLYIISIVFGLIAILYIYQMATGKINGERASFYHSHIFYIILLSLIGISGVWEFLRHRSEHPFRDARFVFFIFILIPVQTLFAHNWLTLPYYLDRAFIGSVVSEYFEVFSNLNPILIFIFAPVIAALTAKANVYKMMILGTFVMALPTFLLVFGPNMWILLSYILLMTIGEAMWQPRFLQWIAEIAPKGKTGAYMGIGQFPWFLTKLITSFYSGYFVANYIPKPEDNLPLRTEQMWLIYGVIAVISPIALVLAKKWMEKGMKK